MARNTETIVTLIDDLDGTKADRTVTFAFEGVNYEIELSKKNAAAFEKALKPYVDAGRRTRSGSSVRAKSTARNNRSAVAGRSPSRSDLSAVREWAQANGHQVSERGRIARSVQDAYDAAH